MISVTIAIAALIFGALTAASLFGDGEANAARLDKQLTVLAYTMTLALLVSLMLHLDVIRISWVA